MPVGNVPSLDGSCGCKANTVGQGALQFPDKNANVVKTLTSTRFLDGPWGLTINEEKDFAQVFVANVLSCKVTRADIRICERDIHDPIKVPRKTQIESGYPRGCAGTASVAGLAGLAYDKEKDIPCVPSTEDNGIYAVRDAGFTKKDKGTGKVVVQLSISERS